MAGTESEGLTRSVNQGSKETPHAACPCGNRFDATSGADAPSAARERRGAAASIARRHLVCRECQRRIEQHVEQRFGRHRHRAALANDVSDFVQDCYEKLQRPSGLAAFVAPSDAQARPSAFRGWLWTVVHNHCNVTLKRWRRRIPEMLPPDRRPPRSVRPPRPLTPEEAFSRQCCLEMVQASIATVKQRWEARGRGERFAVLIGYLSEDGSSYADVAARLGLERGHLRVLVHELREDLREARFKTVRDTLDLPRGLDPAGTKRLIEREIEELMKWCSTDLYDGTEGGEFEK